MQAFQEPLVSIAVTSNSFSAIRNELKTFGLNPNDWRAARQPQADYSRLILVHCEDDELRLGVNLKPSPAALVPLVIADVEWIVS